MTRTLAAVAAGGRLMVSKSRQISCQSRMVLDNEH
jgi:hypothetical protein